MNEEWRPALGFEGRYEVSSLGRVASLPTRTWPTRRLLSVSFAKKRGGYARVVLRRDGKQFARPVHVLVCEAFHGVRPDGMQVRHLDGQVLNNAATNLAWGTAAENERDKVRHGTHQNAVKDTCKDGHPLAGPNLYITPSTGARQCRTCRRRDRANYRARKAAA